MIKEDLKKLKELKWEVWNVRDEIKDKDIKNKLEKLLYKIVDIIDEQERELLYKIVKECEEELSKKESRVEDGNKQNNG